MTPRKSNRVFAKILSKGAHDRGMTGFVLLKHVNKLFGNFGMPGLTKESLDGLLAEMFNGDLK